MVIAKKTDKGFLVGYSGTNSYMDMIDEDILLPENQAFWQVRDTDDVYLFATGASRGFDVLKYNDELFKRTKNGINIVRDIVPKMKELLAENDALINGNEWDNELILVKGKKAFTISRVFIVTEVENFLTVPRNAYVEGGMEANKQKSPLGAILSAAKTKERMVQKRVFPLTVFNTETKESKVYYQAEEI